MSCGNMTHACNKNNNNKKKKDNKSSRSFVFLHFWRPKTPCLWPPGRRSSEGLRCPERGRRRQTSQSGRRLQLESHLRWRVRPTYSLLWLHFSVYIFRLWRNLMNVWLAFAYRTSLLSAEWLFASSRRPHGHVAVQAVTVKRKRAVWSELSCCPNPLLLRTFWIVNTSILFYLPHKPEPPFLNTHNKKETHPAVSLCGTILR